MALISWELLSSVFTAETIMTPRADLVTWEQSTSSDPARREAERQGFDLIPVVTKTGRIIGMLNRDNPKPEPLIARWLVSRDTPLPDLVTLFAETEREAFLILHRQEIVGLVAPADLNKLPARVYIYSLIAELEMALAACVHRFFNGQSEEILDLLSENRRAALAKARQGNVDTEVFEQLYLSDIIGIVAKREGLQEQLGFQSRSEVKKQLGSLNCLRNRTMHPVKLLLTNAKDDVAKLNDRIQRARSLLENLAQQ